MKINAFTNWVSRTVINGWQQLLRFNFFSKTIQLFKHTSTSVNKQATVIPTNKNVDIKIHSSKPIPLPESVDTWVKEIHNKQNTPENIEKLMHPIIDQVEKNAAVFHCRIEQGTQEKQQHLIVISPTLKN